MMSSQLVVFSLVLVAVLVAFTSARLDKTIITEADNKTVCLIVQGNFSVNFNYSVTINGTTTTKDFTWTLSPATYESIQNSTCADDLAQLSPVINTKNSTKDDFTLNEFVVSWLRVKNVFELRNVSVKATVTVENKPVEIFSESGSLDMYKTPTINSLQCKSENTISLKSTTINNPDVKVNVSEVILSEMKVQAFPNTKNGQFAQPIPCQADDNGNEIVPIIVGCALAGLILIVLVFYIIARKRASNAASYDSL